MICFILGSISSLQDFGLNGDIMFDKKDIPDLKTGKIIEAGYEDTETGKDQWGVVYKITEDAICTLKGYCADLSAGTGRNTRSMLKQPGITHVVATDIDPRPLEILSKNIPEEYKSKLTTQSDVNLLEELPFSDNTFDGILVAGVMHFFEEPEFRYICGELDRLTKPGGRVVIELQTDIDRTNLKGEPVSYLSGGSPDDLKIYTTEKAKELIPELFRGYSIDIKETHFKGVLREENTDSSVPPYVLDCNNLVFNMEKNL